MFSDNDEIVLKYAIEIEPLDVDTFLKVAETLTRIGVAARSEYNEVNILWQSVHLLHKQGRYFIIHFKQLFLLDGKLNKTDITLDDMNRLNNIALMLSQWNLIHLKQPTEFIKDVKVCIIPFRDKSKWVLESKYEIGKKERTIENE